MPTKEPKDSTDLDLAAENARLREQVARLEGRTEGLAQATSTSLDAREGHIFDVFTTSVFDLPSKGLALPHPESWIVVLDRGSRSRAVMLTVIGSKGRRVVKVDGAPWIDPTLGPWLRRDEVAARYVKNSILRRYIPEPHLREQVLKMDAGQYRQEISGHPYGAVAQTYENLFGRGRPANHALITRLDQPIYRLQGLPVEQIKSLVERFEELEPGAALPSWWEDPQTSEGFVPFETETPLPATIDPEKDAFDNPPAKPSPPTGPGRY